MDTWKHPLKRALESISFHNRDQYRLDILFNLNGVWAPNDTFYVVVERHLKCSQTNKLLTVRNNFLVSREITANELIEQVFVALGQFEAHEFVETFKVNGKQFAYPHDRVIVDTLPSGEIVTIESSPVSILSNGEAINDKIMDFWPNLLTFLKTRKNKGERR